MGWKVKPGLVYVPAASYADILHVDVYEQTEVRHCAEVLLERARLLS